MARFRSNPPKRNTNRIPPTTFDSPIDEFHYLVDELEHIIFDARREHVQRMMTPRQLDTSPRASLRNFFSRRIPLKRNDKQQYDHSDQPTDNTINAAIEQQDDQTNASTTRVKIPTSHASSASSPRRTSRFKQTRRAEFMPLPIDPVVEHLRRIAELVVTGENYMTSLQNKERAKLERFRDKWKNRDVLDDLMGEENDDAEDKDLDIIRNDPKTKDYMQLFDLFFERQVLDTIISLLTGAAFELTLDEAKERASKIHVDEPQESAENEDNKAHDKIIDKDERVKVCMDDVEMASEASIGVVPTEGDPMQLDEKTIQSTIHNVDGDQPMAIDNEEESSEVHRTEATEHSKLATPDTKDAVTTVKINFIVDDTEQAENGTIRKPSLPAIQNPQRQANTGVELVDEPLMLPPIEIARQGLQSVSILIQNVSRATSLFIILSNNRINDLIDLPLDAYTVSQGHELGVEVSAETNSELAELVTHFVTFLKSLAMRMNAETLQFFLKYPPPYLSEEQSGHDNLQNEDAITPDDGNNVKGSVCVEFLLYERALEFCDASQESFVRTTALNICLNTLRLASVASVDDSDNNEFDQDTKSPSGVLHDSKPLPLRERLAIALFTCLPSRVELLMSPICSKLAEKWAALDEQVREFDVYCKSFNYNVDDEALSAARANTEMRRAHEIANVERLTRTLKQRAADLLDELHLLNDVFSVGLTILNEQLIEMLLATFVYPLLLQPLHLYAQRLSSIKQDAFENILIIYPIDGREADTVKSPTDTTKLAGPAITALMTLGALFHTITNMPFLKLVFTALLHPLSPDTSTLPTIRSRLERSTLENGKNAIRLDIRAVGEPSDKSSYAFGREKPGDDKRQALDPRDVKDVDASVFVLAPALADVLELNSETTCTHAVSDFNPYRLALFAFLHVSDPLAEVRELALGVLDAALSAIDSRLISETLFGFGQEVDDHTTVVNILIRSTIAATKMPQSRNGWKLRYDEVAAHALLCCYRTSHFSLSAACDTLERLIAQAAALMASFTFESNSPMGGSEIRMAGMPSINLPDYEDLITGAMRNLVLYDAIDGEDTAPVAHGLLCYSTMNDEPVHCLPIACDSDFHLFYTRIGRHVVDRLSADREIFSIREEVLLARTGLEVLLKGNALLNCMRNIQASECIITDFNPSANVALSSDSSLMNVTVPLGNSNKCICGPLSGPIGSLLYQNTEFKLPEEGSTVILGTIPFVTCVSEIADAFAGLFAAGDGGVVAEGVTWQSLYLGFTEGCLIIVHPRPDESNAARGVIVSVCELERLSVKADACSFENDSPARRMVLSCSWFEKTPPLLFHFDNIPEDELCGPFKRSTPFSSSLDVWFEDQKVADLALKILSSQIFAAKAERGQRVTKKLLQRLSLSTDSSFKK
ncbi:hypothetical protein MPSEU_000474000 [Mayamaea pseudoterrestris]|nr:hypothetical protein MPSEU_000474000 [Mayamaea pseudoterrestris]